MKKPLIALVASAFLLSGCAAARDSRLNPFNWFGRGQQEDTLATEVEGLQTIPDGRELVAEVISLEIDRTPGGAIIRAVGLPPTQGFYDGELVAEDADGAQGGVLSYQFRIAESPRFEVVSTQRSREVVVALFLSNVKLEGVRSIRVVASQNSRVSRR